MHILIYLAGFLSGVLHSFAEAQVLIQDTDPNCIPPHQLYRVGLGTPAQFTELYRTCYDRNNVATIYTQHTMYQTTRLANCPRDSWRTSGLLTPREAGFMRRAHIRSVTSATFPNYDRGHLAACGDFPTAAQRRATMEIINSLPQLSELNLGEWKRMEAFLQQSATANGVNIVTGGLGVLQYQGTPVYLSGASTLPIPEFMYKVARVNGAAQNVLYAFIAYNYNGPVNQLHLAAYCTNVGCPIVFNQIICCDPRKFIEKNLPAFKPFFGIQVMG